MELTFANVAAALAVLVATFVWIEACRTREEVIALGKLITSLAKTNADPVLSQIDYLRRHIDVVAAGHARDMHTEVGNQLAAIQRTLEVKLPPATLGQVQAPIENLAPALRSKRKRVST